MLWIGLLVLAVATFVGWLAGSVDAFDCAHGGFGGWLALPEDAFDWMAQGCFVGFRFVGVLWPPMLLIVRLVELLMLSIGWFLAALQVLDSMACGCRGFRFCVSPWPRMLSTGCPAVAADDCELVARCCSFWLCGTWRLLRLLIHWAVYCGCD